MRVLPAFGVFLLLTSSGAAPAAAVPADTLRPLSPARQLSYTYANDLFFRTDYYFTQGMTLTLVHPALARLPTRHVQLRGAAGSTQYHGLMLRYDGFTPLRIQDDFIRVGDRPHASYIYASFFRTSHSPARRSDLTSALELGFIGPAAGAKGFQTAIHRYTNNPTPRGWNYQIGTDAVLGYRVGYKKQLLAAAGLAEVVGTTDASLSTLYTYASAGALLRLGHLPAGGWALGLTDGVGDRGRRWRVVAQASLEGRLVGYDATLQGGLFNRKSPYTLPAAAIRRTVLRRGAGVVLAHRNLQLSASSTWITPEFADARAHAWTQFGITGGF